MASRLYAEQVNQEANRSGFSEFMRNPLGFIMQKQNVNIPQQYANNPEGAVQYLLSSGAMTPQGLENIKKVASRMGVNV